MRFYGLEQDGLLAFMLMDFVTGTSLRTEIFKLGGAPMSRGRVRWILEPVCSALHYAHRSGIVHCDLKPGNVMIEDTGKVLVTDFGIARLTDAATATMVGLGTPAYMAPEQVRGLDPTPQTDIYALGVVLFEMLTGGERPFTGEEARTTGSTSEKVRWEQVHQAPPSPKQYNSDISPELEALVFKCLAKEPGERYQSALELLNALELVLAEEVLEEPSLSEVEPLPLSPMVEDPTPVPVAQPAPMAPAPAARPLPWGWIGGLGVLAVAILLTYLFGAGSGRLGRSATQTALAGATIRTETAIALAILPSDTPSRHAATTLPTATNTKEPTSSPSPTPTVIHPTVESSLPSPKLAPTSEKIQLIEWDMQEFKLLPSGYPDGPIPNVSYWCAEGNQVKMSLYSKEGLVIDPNWKNPYLLFWYKISSFHSVRTSPSVVVRADSNWEQLKIYGTRSPAVWNRDALDLNRYKGKNIRIWFNAETGSDDWGNPVSSLSSWCLTDIHIISDFSSAP